MSLTQRRRRRRIVGGAIAVTFVLFECLRVWLPSIHGFIGEDGMSSVLVIAVVLATLAVAGVLATGVERIGARPLWTAGGTLLVLGRGALIFTDGGGPQSVAATVAVIGGSVAIMALAAASPAPHHTRIGILVGLSAAAVLHATTGTLGLIWPTTAWTTAVSAALLLGLIEVVRRTAIAVQGPRRSPTPTAAWPWLILLPLLLLVGQISGVPGRLTAVTGWSPTTVAMVITSTHVAGIVAALVAPRLGPVTAGWSGASLVLVGTIASLPATGWPGVVGPVLCLIGLGVILGVDAVNVRRTATARRHAQVTAWAVAGFGVATTLYHASYRLPIDLNNRWVPLAATLIAVGVGLATSRTGRMATSRVHFSVITALQATAVAIVVVLLVGVCATSTVRPPVEGVDDGRARVALLNMRSGFDTRSRFAPREQARVLRATNVDVVVLNEVDRGWLSTGGHDALTLFANELGFPHLTFARAADELWGNAIVSRFPIVERTATRLPRGSDTMARSEVTVVLDLDEERQLGVIATQLSAHDQQGDTRLPQARAVAASAARLRERQIPTVVAGDMQAASGSPELATFLPLVADIVPSTIPTLPSPASGEQHDRVLASADLRRVRVEAPNVSVSDHVPLIVTLELLEHPRGGR